MILRSTKNRSLWAAAVLAFLMPTFTSSEAMSFTVQVSTVSYQGVAGVEGTLLYDARVLDATNVSLAPGQPASFVLRWFEKEAGEIKFVVYSATDVLQPDLAILRLDLTLSPSAANDSKSVVVSEIRTFAGSDGILEGNDDPYSNHEIILQESVNSSVWIIQ